MPYFCFDEASFRFPPVGQADEDGLLLIGGQVTPPRILEAYSKGIFPWYNAEELPLWWSPDPRFVVFPSELHVSRSMRKLMAKQIFQFKMDTAFESVIHSCSSIARKGQNGTWLTPEMKQAYTSLFYEGYAHSAETWEDGALVGGLYGIRLGGVFFGESMFSYRSNASKFAFINYINHLKSEGVALIDCQVFTPHVETLGGRLISRESFLQLLKKFL